MSASAYRHELNGWAQFHQRMNEKHAAEEVVRQKVHEASLKLSELLPDEERWEAFWATIAEDASNPVILDALLDEIERVGASEQRHRIAVQMDALLSRSPSRWAEVNRIAQANPADLNAIEEAVGNEHRSLDEIGQRQDYRELRMG